ncbi:MAG: sulfurtransferase, partial [Pedobacter sp.]
MKLSPIIQPTELINLSPNKFILFDASAGSKARYDEKHLVGAHYIDLNTDLAEIGDFAIGGRHPLPTVEQFAKVLGQFGVEENTHVVIYDDKNGSNAAARFWWMLRAIGHEKVQVLNGGFDAAVKAGFAVDSLKPESESKKPYPINSWQLPVVALDEVEVA